MILPAPARIRDPMTPIMADLLQEIGPIAPGGMTAMQRSLYELYNKQKLDKRDRLVKQAFYIGSYTHVANIDNTNPEVAYMHTQNGPLTESWSMKPTEMTHPVGKTYHDFGDDKKYGRRSTDIGDLVETEDGKFYVVSEFGFVQVTFPRRLTDDETAQVRDVLTDSGRVSAVKLYRTLTNAPLADAVHFVESDSDESLVMWYEKLVDLVG